MHKGLIVLCLVVLLSVHLQPVTAREVQQDAAAAFEASLVQEAVEEAVDLSSGLPEDQREMESLLHWAIGELLLGL